MRWVPVLILLACDADDAEPEPPPDTCDQPFESTDTAYPEGPYGTAEGDVFADFELADCDGNPVAFRDILPRADLVVFNVGAGWCAPCVEETRRLEAEVFQAYCGRRVAVVQVLFEDANARPATAFFCNEWRDAHGLTFPVLRDPLFTTGRFFEDAQAETPLNLLIDRRARIVYREVGTAAEGLGARIESALAAQQ